MICRSLSVSFPHFSCTLPEYCFHLPSICSQFMTSLRSVIRKAHRAQPRHVQQTTVRNPPEYPKVLRGLGIKLYDSHRCVWRGKRCRDYENRLLYCGSVPSRFSEVKNSLRFIAACTAGIAWRPDSLLKKQPQAPAFRAFSTNEGRSLRVVRIMRFLVLNCSPRRAFPSFVEEARKA